MVDILYVMYVAILVESRGCCLLWSKKEFEEKVENLKYILKKERAQSFACRGCCTTLSLVNEKETG